MTRRRGTFGIQGADAVPTIQWRGAKVGGFCWLPHPVSRVPDVHRSWTVSDSSASDAPALTESPTVFAQRIICIVSNESSVDPSDFRSVFSDFYWKTGTGLHTFFRLHTLTQNCFRCEMAASCTEAAKVLPRPVLSSFTEEASGSSFPFGSRACVCLTVCVCVWYFGDQLCSVSNEKSSLQHCGMADPSRPFDVQPWHVRISFFFRLPCVCFIFMLAVSGRSAFTFLVIFLEFFNWKTPANFLENLS